MMTFEELNDSIGAEAIYSGTSVDAATQAALLEWNFDRFLSMEGEDTTNWLRKYRRNLNMFYPIYLDRLRVESVRSNMDPFITEFMEKVHDDNGTVTKAGSSVKNGSKGGSDTEQTVTDNTQVRTPDLTTTGSNSTQGSSSTSGSDASRQLSESSGQAHGESEDNGKARGMQIQYPEANMNGIPQNIDDFPTSIDYAQGEADNFTKANHEEDSNNSQLGEVNTTGNSSSQSSSSSNGSSSAHEGGDETIDFDGNVIKTKQNNSTDTESATSNESSSDSRTIEETEQGRHESPADILPRAIKAITATNSIKWLVETMLICFDNYAEM